MWEKDNFWLHVNSTILRRTYRFNVENEQVLNKLLNKFNQILNAKNIVVLIFKSNEKKIPCTTFRIFPRHIYVLRVYLVTKYAEMHEEKKKQTHFQFYC